MNRVPARPRVAAGVAGVCVVLGGLVAGGGLATPSRADSFTPITLGITVPQIARRGQPLPITVVVSADADALDGTGTMMVQVKLAAECGGTYLTTPGTVLMSQPLTPQPTSGKPYTGTLRGAGTPSAFGVQTVCVFVDESSDHRQFATSQQFTVNVSKPCTTTAASFDRAFRRLAAALRERRGIARARSIATHDKQAATRACGTGVKL